MQSSPIPPWPKGSSRSLAMWPRLPLGSLLLQVSFLACGNFPVKAVFILPPTAATEPPGSIHVALESNHFARTRIILAPQQLAQFQSLVQQAKAKLDSLRAVK